MEHNEDESLPKTYAGTYEGSSSDQQTRLYEEEQSVQTRGKLASMSNYVAGIVTSPLTYWANSKSEAYKSAPIKFSVSEVIFVSAQEALVEKLYKLAKACLLSDYKEAPARLPVCERGME